MRILLTGANGYIGKRLLPVLQEQGHHITCIVRDSHRFQLPDNSAAVEVIEMDLLQPSAGTLLPNNIDVAYFLIHSMSSSKHFESDEEKAAENFTRLLESTSCRQIIYLGGIANAEKLSRHLSSRLRVEKVLKRSGIPVTTLRAGIIVGSGSSSFEIVRDLVEKIPVMITPKWVQSRCQPIAIKNVLELLCGVALRESTYNQHFDIGGPDVLTYQQMLKIFAEVRRLKRWIIPVPVMSPRLSSYWLYFITSTTYPLAVQLVNSMKVDVVAKPNRLIDELGIRLINYREAVQLAFQKIEQNEVVSSWTDAFSITGTSRNITAQIKVPKYGCLRDVKRRMIRGDREPVLKRIWAIGGNEGWYYGNTLWKIRGLMDKLFGGVGLRKGRSGRSTIRTGDAIDFWRVMIADRAQGRLLLYAEMKLPGEAWLEFRVKNEDGASWLEQTATFRPQGLWGRMYWYAVLPFHYFIFNGMINALVK